MEARALPSVGLGTLRGLEAVVRWPVARSIVLGLGFGAVLWASRPAGAPLAGIARADARGAWFATGQSADLLLSGYGFNRTGGPLRFNHPGGVAIVAGNLVLADRNNNRVLIWRGVPAVGDPPVLVLGQDGFDTNEPGEGLDGLDWPTAVATDGARLYVADAYNDRVLVWRGLPTRNHQPADFALTRASGVQWPWGIWTDGRSPAVSATGASRVLLWRSVPEADRAPDMELRIPEFGTPRSIGSDGIRLVVSDHNARVSGQDGPGNFFWTSFPASASQAYSFFMAAAPTGSTPIGGSLQGEHFHGLGFLPDGRLLALANNSLCLWAGFPRSASEPCAVRIGGGAPGSSSVALEAGDNSGLALSGEQLVLSLNNGNKAVVYRTLPAADGQRPDYAIGSPDTQTNTLTLDGIVTNPVPLTDGTRLWISSDFDRRLHVWRSLPRESGRKADLVYDLDFAPWASARVGSGLALAGQGVVALWNSPPEGQPADIVLRNAIGGVTLGQLRGVAWDGTYFSLASYDANRVFVWRGLPSAGIAPAAQLTVEQPGRISTDGRYLAVTSGTPGGAILLYDVARLTTNPEPLRVGQAVRPNLPQGVLLAEGALFVADTNNNRVLGWRDVQDAVAGRDPDLVLGATDFNPRKPWISADRLFWPGAVTFDGVSLWVGEFKFSNRVLRFSAR
jgi:hypothetical protein